MPHGMLSILWYLWVNNVIQVNTVIKALGPMTYKTGVKVKRNNFGIPHFVWVCKTCKKNYD
jgi:hypothetical protein